MNMFRSEQAKPKRQANDLTKRRAAVMRVVDRLVEDAKDLSSHLQDPRSLTLPLDHLAVWQLVEVLGELRPVIHHRLYFSPTLQYLYATQLAKKAEQASASGESVEIVEGKLSSAHREREVALTSREDLVASLKAQLHELDSAGTQAVRTCRQEARAECEEVRANSESNLQQQQTDLQYNLQAMKRQEERHEEVELDLRGKRQQLESQMQLVIRQYDATMSQLQTNLDQLKDDHASLSVQLEKKMGELSIVEERYRCILEEKQRAEEARLAAMQAEFRREHAARTIQRAWAHYKMRKMLKKAQRKRKKKPKDAKDSKK